MASAVSHDKFGESTGRRPFESLRINGWESREPGHDRIGQSNTAHIDKQGKNYPLVIKRGNWKSTRNGVSIGKSPINSVSSIAMFHY